MPNPAPSTNTTNPTDEIDDRPIDTELVNRCFEGQSATLNRGGMSTYPGDARIANEISAVGSVEGVFISDNSIIIDNVINDRQPDDDSCRVDKRFLGQGTFVAWSSVQLLRDFNNRDSKCNTDIYGVYNNRVPTETFIYRPDLVRNLPAWMRRSAVYYQERVGG